MAEKRLIEFTTAQQAADFLAQYCEKSAAVEYLIPLHSRGSWNKSPPATLVTALRLAITYPSHGIQRVEVWIDGDSNPSSWISGRRSIDLLTIAVKDTLSKNF